MLRTAYLLTGNSKSERALFCENVLNNIGFNIKIITYIPHNDKVISNKISMQHIYKLIKDSDDDTYHYVFEDDINILNPIKLEEIIEYEKLTDTFFYLGLCEYDNHNSKLTSHKINGNNVYSISGGIRGLHAIGLSKIGAEKLLSFSENVDDRYMDVILEKFSLIYPTICVRYDLESYIYGHKGIIFQDRKKFPSSIGY
jgi:hypothetical protein